MNIPEIIRGMQAKNLELQNKVMELPDLYEAKAQAERDYLVTRAKKILQLKAEGMSVTLINQLAKGDEEVAKKKMEMEVKEAIWDACRKQIYAINTAIDTYRSILSFNKEEYRNAGVG